MSFGQLKTAKAIYVLCPGGIQTGGPELLHQLVLTLNSVGREAYIVYYPTNQVWHTPEVYIRYQCQQAENIPDEKKVVVIVPETLPSFLDGFKYATCVIWWLSVDNYRGNLDTSRYIKIWLKKSLVHGFKSRADILHLFQSEYAKVFVKKRFNANGEMLSDYLADEYLLDTNKASKNRIDMVVYNPLKGAKFTQKIRQALPSVTWKPLEKMTRAQVRETLESAKVYIDFGTHPGKDRIPREAAMSGCVVVVGKRGSACFDEDVAIVETYKYAVRSNTVSAITSQICAIIADYSHHYEAQNFYRETIQAEPNLFKQQVIKLFVAA
jgi:hypothetical protein